MSYDNEKLKEMAAVTPESELDEMFDENIVGAALRPTVVGCPIGPVVISPTLKFDWCPTSACTFSCRF